MSNDTQEAMHETQINVLKRDVIVLLEKTRNLKIESVPNEEDAFSTMMDTMASHLSAIGQQREAEALQIALEQCLEDKEHAGLGFSIQTPFTKDMREAAAFQVEAWLESLNSEDRARAPLQPLSSRPGGRRPMTLSEKIFAHHTISSMSAEGLAVGDLVRVSVDWVISSELAWAVRTLMQFCARKARNQII